MGVIGSLPLALGDPTPINPFVPTPSPGDVFSLFSVSQVSLTTIQVIYTRNPLASNDNGLNDALNIFNYTLLGPGPVIISDIVPTSGNPQSVNLILASPLALGLWTLTVSPNVQMVDGTPIQPPESLTFQITLFSGLNIPSGGALNSTAEDLIHKYLNPALIGNNWDSIVAGLAVGEQYNYDTAETAFDQLFVISASSLYLDRLSTDNGIIRPQDLGMSDDLFRQYTIKTTNHKLTEEAFLEILEIFYGADSVRAHNKTLFNEPYIINEGDNLQILIDGHQFVNVIFHSIDFTNSLQALAIEVASTINRAFQLNKIKAYALVKIDPITNGNFVVIYTNSLGLLGSVTITGGKAQNNLIFSEYLELQLVGLPTWNIVPDLATGILRFTTTSSTAIDLNGLLIGDYVNIFGSEFASQNKGTFSIINVQIFYVGLILTQYFEVYNPNGIQQLGLVQTNIADLLYFRPIKETIYNMINRAVIVSQPDYETDIILPATSQAVNRKLLEAAYVQDNLAQDIISLERLKGVVIVNLTSHQLEAGNQVFIDNVYGIPFTPPVIPGVNVGFGGTSDSSKASIWSNTVSGPGELRFEHGIVVKLLDGNAFLAGGSTSNGFINTNNNLSSYFNINSVTNNPDTTIVVNYDYNAAPNSLTSNLNNAKASVGNSNDNFLEGQVIVSGGDDGVTTYTNSYYFNTIANSWIVGPSLNTKRSNHTQDTLNNGSILVTGGFSLNLTTATNTVEILSGPAYTWVTKAPMNKARAGHQLIILQNGKILVIGGIDSSVLSNTCEIYDPIGNTWTYTGFMTFARLQHKAILLPDGKVLVVGGIGRDPTHGGDPVQPLIDSEIYNPITGLWGPAGQTLYTHDSGIAEYLPLSNQVILVGGAATTHTEVYNVSTKTWSIGIASLPAIRKFAQSLTFNNNIMMLFGGQDSNNVTSNEDFMYISNADHIASGNLNGSFEVNRVIDANHFTYLTDNTDYTLNDNNLATVTLVRADDGIFPGPYMYDTKDGVALTDISTFITQDLDKGLNYNILNVIDALKFPDTQGWLCFDFGYEQQVAPVQYFGRISNTQLALDDGFIFPKTINAGGQVSILAGGTTGSTVLTISSSPVAIPIGSSLLISGGIGNPEVGITTTHVYIGDTTINLAIGLTGNNRDQVIIALVKVHLLAYKGFFQPVDALKVGSFYLTDSPSGRTSALIAIKAAKGAGLVVHEKIIYPGDLGLGASGFPTSNNEKLSDIVSDFSDNDIDQTVAKARLGIL